MAINMITKKLVLFGIVLFLSISFATAFPQVVINTEKTYEVGDNIEFSYMIISQDNEIIKYAASVSCDNAPEPLLQLQQIELNRNEPFYNEYSYSQVDENFLTSECYASIMIVDPYEFVKKQKFDVKAKSSFSFDIKVCGDESCEEQAKIFVLGKTVYLGYSSDITPKISATLTSPDGIIDKVTLPTTIKAEQTGSYELKVVASKEGYKTETLKEQFAVIEREPEIKETEICNANNVCDGQENNKNCPIDCPPTDKSEIGTKKVDSQLSVWQRIIRWISSLFG